MPEEKPDQTLGQGNEEEDPVVAPKQGNRGHQHSKGSRVNARSVPIRVDGFIVRTSAWLLLWSGVALIVAENACSANPR